MALLITLEDTVIGRRCQQLFNRDGSHKMKNLSVMGEVYIEKILEPFRFWSAEQGLWLAIPDD
jgi:hypothetical protein